MNLIIHSTKHPHIIDLKYKKKKSCTIKLENHEVAHISSFNSSKNNSTSTKPPVINFGEINLLESELSDKDKIKEYMKTKDEKYKEQICSKCLDQSELIKFLKNEIKIITSDIMKYASITNSKQDLVAKVSDKVNKINIIKFNVYYVKIILEIMNSIGCIKFNENEKLFKNLLKQSNLIVEGLQNSIRKKNLNVNFLILS